jgi:hypothetical protein
LIGDKGGVAAWNKDPLDDFVIERVFVLKQVIASETPAAAGPRVRARRARRSA